MSVQDTYGKIKFDNCPKCQSEDIRFIYYSTGMDVCGTGTRYLVIWCDKCKRASSKYEEEKPNHITREYEITKEVYS